MAQDRSILRGERLDTAEALPPQIDALALGSREIEEEDSLHKLLALQPGSSYDQGLEGRQCHSPMCLRTKNGTELLLEHAKCLVNHIERLQPTAHSSHRESDATFHDRSEIEALLKTEQNKRKEAEAKATELQRQLDERSAASKASAPVWAAIQQASEGMPFQLEIQSAARARAEAVAEKAEDRVKAMKKLLEIGEKRGDIAEKEAAEVGARLVQMQVRLNREKEARGKAQRDASALKSEFDEKLARVNQSRIKAEATVVVLKGELDEMDPRKAHSVSDFGVGGESEEESVEEISVGSFQSLSDLAERASALSEMAPKERAHALDTMSRKERNEVEMFVRERSIERLQQPESFATATTANNNSAITSSSNVATSVVTSQIETTRPTFETVNKETILDHLRNEVWKTVSMEAAKSQATTPTLEAARNQTTTPTPSPSPANKASLWNRKSILGTRPLVSCRVQPKQSDKAAERCDPNVDSDKPEVELERRQTEESKLDPWIAMEQEAEEIFKMIASHHDGDNSVISKEELTAAYGGDFKIWNELDCDSDGKCTLAEWQSFLKGKNDEKGEINGAKWMSTLLHTIRHNLNSIAAAVKEERHRKAEEHLEETIPQERIEAGDAARATIRELEARIARMPEGEDRDNLVEELEEAQYAVEDSAAAEEEAHQATKTDSAQHRLVSVGEQAAQAVMDSGGSTKDAGKAAAAAVICAGGGVDDAAAAATRALRRGGRA